LPSMETYQNGWKNLQGDREHEFIRFRSELEFAQGLCELNPKKAVQWEPLVAEATQRVLSSMESDISRFQASIREAEDLLAPLCTEAKRYTIYCVGHAHIDMNWMWSWPETVAVTNDTFTTVLRLMEEFPEFHFSQSQASVYALIEEHNPALLKQIKKRVREGRWEVTASHWVEGDKNMVGAESLCRHLLYTRAYMRKLFRLEPEDIPVDWSPDTFGHAAHVPTYLTRGGVKYLYLHRPGAHGTPRPSAFWWKSPEGARVLVRNDMALGYNGEIRPEMSRDLLRFANETGLSFVMFVYGVGDHGGGPTRRDLLYAREMNEWPLFPNLEFSPAVTFYKRLEKEGSKLPVLAEELNLEFTGCFTSQSLIKKANRYGEKRLLEAEAAATASLFLCGTPYPAKRLEQGWRDVLFSHFHDILPGSGVRDTRTYAHGLYQRTMAMTGMEEIKALRSLADQVDTAALDLSSFEEDRDQLSGPPSSLQTSLGAGVGFGSLDGGMSQVDQSEGEGTCFFVLFNPIPQPREEVTEVTLWENARGTSQRDLRGVPFNAIDSSGEVVPVQIVDSGHYWGHHFVRVAFPVEVGPWGYSTYAVIESAGEPKDSEAQGRDVSQLGLQHHCSYSFYERSPEGLENEWIRLELNPSTGGIRSLQHKPSQTLVISPPQEAAPFEFVVERPHGMTSWLVDHTGPVQHPEVLSLKRRLSGPYKATIDVRLRVRESEFTLTYELRRGDPTVYLHLQGTWVERGTPQTGIPVLRVAYPFALQASSPRYEIPFGAVSRNFQHGEEVPALRWAMVTGEGPHGSAGCLLLNDCKHGHSFHDGCLRLTLLRSSYDPDPLPEIAQHEVHLGLHPFAGSMKDADAIRLGQRFEHRLRAVSTSSHQGSLPAASHLLRCSPSSVVVGTLKRAEQEEGAIVHVFNSTSRGVTAKLQFNKKLLGQVSKAVEVDLMERPLSQSSAGMAEGNTATVKVPAQGFSALRVQFK